MKMSTKIKTALVVLFMVFLVPLAGCQDKGPAEKAGAKVDSAIEKARKSADQMSEKLEHQVEEAMK